MATKRRQFTLDEVMVYVLEQWSESEISELGYSEDDDYVPEVADRLEEDVEQHVELEEKTKTSDDNEEGNLEMIIILNILEMLTVMMRMAK